MVLKFDSRNPKVSITSDHKESINFIVIADPQLGMYRNNNSWDEELQSLKNVVDDLNNKVYEEDISFAIILGDLVQVMPLGEEPKTPTDILKAKVRDQQTQDVRKVLETIDPLIPVIVTSGNHDVSDSPTLPIIQQYQKEWGYSTYSFWIHKYKFIVLSSGNFFDDTNVKDLAEDEFKWFENEIKDANAQDAMQIIVFMHHPFVVDSWDEPDDLGTMKITPMNIDFPRSHFHLPLKWRKRFQPLIQGNNVTATFHGHMHFDVVKQFGDMEQVVTSASTFPLCGGKPGWRHVHLRGEELSHKFHQVPFLTNDWKPMKSPFE